VMMVRISSGDPIGGAWTSNEFMGWSPGLWG
jgi:hypothetical protein